MRKSLISMMQKKKKSLDSLSVAVNDRGCFFCFRLKKNMKIELTVHLGTLLTHTVHRYAHILS